MSSTLMLQAINGGEAETYLNGGEEAKKTSSKRPRTEKKKTREGARRNNMYGAKITPFKVHSPLIFSISLFLFPLS